ncbi:hypothetical protein LAZ67_19000474 [Cordylochernes scorpioides]|uniref:Transposase n=1 Tax=Cordylochernes scorpioides TaxID=51811 RepID=A0ABY6LHG8_9ARAC|nr:hypothetical protein LAZ67_19000474 [Cordylochernes scorpioides]
MLHTTLVPIDLESSGEIIFIRYHDFCNMGGERLTLQVEQTIRTLSKEGNSYSVIVKKLKAEGLDVGKATICRVVNGIGKKREAESNGQKFQVDRPRPVRTPATVSKVKRLATTENPPSQRQLSRMCGTSLKTINNIIHKDLELDTRRKGKVHKLTPFHMKNRATNARKLYEEHLAGSRSEYTATLDEAWMYVTYCNGIRKICYIKRGNQVPDNWVHQCSETFPKGFMVVGVMTGRGVLPLIKVPSKVKVNSEFYIECVLKPVIEQLKDLYPGEMDKVFLHHDKASSHTSNKTQQFLQEMKDTLGLNFIRNSDIPVKTPDASPLDFYGFEQLIGDFQTQISKFLTVRKVTSNTFLGIEILVKDEDITFSQYISIDKILDKFKMSDCNASFVPGTIGENLDDFKDSKKFSLQIYQEAIGSLMYLSTGTRPDLAFAISNLSQYCKEPYEIHWKALKKVLRYVKGTRNLCLKLTSQMGHLTAFTDASWNNTADAKSFGGRIIKIGDNLLNWKSGKQKIVALITMETELLSFCDGVCVIKFYTSLLEELNMKQLIKEPTPIKTDSKSLIDWIKNQKQNTRTRHFNRKYHFIKDEYVKKTIQTKFVRTEQQEADLLTKNLSGPRLKNQTKMLGMDLDFTQD